MEIGVNGASGALVLKLADRESSPDLVSVIHQLLNMVERNALEKEWRPKCVTTKSPAQVTNAFLQVFVFYHSPLMCIYVLRGS